MIEIIICLVIWFWGLTPLWLNILLSCLLFVRFSWRVTLTITKVFKFNNSLEASAHIERQEKEENDGVSLTSISYRGFEDWDDFVSRYKDASFSSPSEREQFIQDFNSVSQLMWDDWLKTIPPADLSSLLSEAWFSPLGEKEETSTPEQVCKSVLGHCRYASDRMNINRWLRIRVLLNLIIE